jgi:hypothetical protein
MGHPLSEDTSPEAERVQLDILRRLPPWRKVQMVADGWECSRELALAGLRQRHPEASELALQRRLARLMLGDELALKVYGNP